MNNKKLLQEALNVLEIFGDSDDTYKSPEVWEKSKAVALCTRLRAAIAQPKPNPIGYLMKNSWDFVPGNEPPEGDSDAVYMEPVQSAYVPLTDAQIKAVSKAVYGSCNVSQDLAFARAIEKAVRGAS